MLTPTLEGFRKACAGGGKVPLRRKIPADLDTPVSAYLKLESMGAVFLLESVEQGTQLGRYSFIGISPYASVKLQDGTVETRRCGRVEARPLDPAHPFAPVREALAAAGRVLDEGIPGPFAGAVGYIAYDMVHRFERVPLPGEGALGLPEYHFLFPETLAVFDHAKSEIELVTLPPEGAPEQAYAAAAQRIEGLLEALTRPLPGGYAAPPARTGEARAPVSNMTEEQFQERVHRAKEHILAGDAFQIVLSQRLAGETEAPPFRIYRALRMLNPSPYMFFIDFQGYQLIGSSPEVLVKLEKRKATLCPIAGTRRRGDTPAADRLLEEELLSDEKERAEHVMLVDLGRNDLGRVCEMGSVATESLMHIEKYSHVMHIVSRVTGTLREDKSMFDLLRAAFPAGTVTGAPKIRAMQIISDLEGNRRGPYAGAVGYFGRGGDMDLCITIRTLVMKGRSFYAQAGAGIVADSDPAFEYRESLQKVQALVRAVEIAEEGF